MNEFSKLLGLSMMTKDVHCKETMLNLFLNRNLKV